jgi:hypothetical protein
MSLREKAIKASMMNLNTDRDGCSVRFKENGTYYVAANGKVKNLDTSSPYAMMGLWMHL